MKTPDRIFEDRRILGVGEKGTAPLSKTLPNPQKLRLLAFGKYGIPPAPRVEPSIFGLVSMDGIHLLAVAASITTATP